LFVRITSYTSEQGGVMLVAEDQEVDINFNDECDITLLTRQFEDFSFDLEVMFDKTVLAGKFIALAKFVEKFKEWLLKCKGKEAFVLKTELIKFFIHFGIRYTAENGNDPFGSIVVSNSYENFGKEESWCKPFSAN